jgi:hypothetical protein
MLMLSRAMAWAETALAAMAAAMRVLFMEFLTGCGA